MTNILKSTFPIFAIFLALISINAHGETCQTICQNQISACSASASEQRQRLLNEGDQWADKEMWREAVDHFGSMTPEKCAAANQSCPAKCEKKLAKKNAERQKKEDLKAAVQKLSKEDFDKLKAEIAAIEDRIEASHRRRSTTR